MSEMQKQLEEKQIVSTWLLIPQIAWLLLVALWRLPRAFHKALQDKESSANYATAVFLLLVLLIGGLWYGGTRYIRSHKSSEEAGQVGDTFGAINALFSGIALAGVIIAIVLQTAELRAQREEIQESQRIATENTKENAKTAQQLMLTGYVSASVALLNPPETLTVDQEKQLLRIRTALNQINSQSGKDIGEIGLPSRKRLLLDRLQGIMQTVNHLAPIDAEMDKARFELLDQRLYSAIREYQVIEPEIPIGLRRAEEILIAKGEILVWAKRCRETWERHVEGRGEKAKSEFYSSTVYNNEYKPFMDKLNEAIDYMNERLGDVHHGVEGWSSSYLDG